MCPKPASCIICDALDKGRNGVGCDLLDKVSQRLQETRLSGDKGDGRALATGDDEGITLVQLRGRPDFDDSDCYGRVGAG